MDEAKHDDENPNCPLNHNVDPYISADCKCTDEAKREARDYVKRLDELFCTAFDTNHPAMQDYALLKMELKSKDKALSERDAEIAKRDATLAEKDKEIERLTYGYDSNKLTTIPSLGDEYQRGFREGYEQGEVSEEGLDRKQLEATLKRYETVCNEMISFLKKPMNLRAESDLKNIIIKMNNVLKGE